MQVKVWSCSPQSRETVRYSWSSVRNVVVTYMIGLQFVMARWSAVGWVEGRRLSCAPRVSLLAKMGGHGPSLDMLLTSLNNEADS